MPALTLLYYAFAILAISILNLLRPGYERQVFILTGAILAIAFLGRIAEALEEIARQGKVDQVKIPHGEEAEIS